MAIDPSISLAFRQPQVESPLDTFSKTASIADMLSQIQERRAQAAAIAEEAPLRRARLQAEQRQLAETQATNTAFDNSVSYDQEAGDVNIDEAKLAQSFQSQNMMHLLPGAIQKKGEFLSKYRQQGLDETKQAIDAAKIIGGQITNFLALSDEEKKAEWPNLRPNVVAVHKPAGKTMGYTWDKDVIEPQLQAFKKDYETLQNVHDNLQQRTDEEKLRLTTAKGREQEIADQIREFTAQNGRPPDQEESDAIRNGVNEKAGYNAKITRKTQARPTTFQQKTERIEKAYASTLGKPYEDLTDAERIAADKWYQEQLPAKETDKQRMINLAQTNPELFSFVTGHTMAGQIKPLTEVQRSQAIDRINALVEKEFPGDTTSKEAQAYKEQLFKEREAYGFDLRKPAPPSAPPQSKVFTGVRASRAAIIAAAKKVKPDIDEDTAVKRFTDGGGTLLP